MDWTQFALLWGPATPFIALLVWGHWFLLYRFLPKQARRFALAMKRQRERQDDRHVQTLTALEEIHKTLKHIAGDVHHEPKQSHGSNGTHAKQGAKPAPHKKKP